MFYGVFREGSESSFDCTGKEGEEGKENRARKKVYITSLVTCHLGVFCRHLVIGVMKRQN